MGQPGTGQLDPAQVRLDVKEAVVAHQHLQQVGVALEAGQFAHPGHVLGALRIQQPVGVVVEQQGDHGLGEQLALQGFGGHIGGEEPLPHLVPAGNGGLILLAVRTAAALLAQGDDQLVTEHPGQRGIHLPECQRFLGAEIAVIGMLQVVPIAGLPAQQPEEGKRVVHTSIYTLSA